MVDDVPEIKCYVTGPITKGSLVLFHEDEIDDERAPWLMNELRRIAGHDAFLVIQMAHGASVKVHGPEELKEAIRQMVKEERSATK